MTVPAFNYHSSIIAIMDKSNKASVSYTHLTLPTTSRV